MLLKISNDIVGKTGEKKSLHNRGDLSVKEGIIEVDLYKELRVRQCEE